MAGNFDNEIKQAMGGGTANTTPAKSAAKMPDRGKPPATPGIQKPPAAPLTGHSSPAAHGVVNPASAVNTPMNDPIVHAAGIAHAILAHGGR